jgi:hypothetical protein
LSDQNLVSGDGQLKRLFKSLAKRDPAALERMNRELELARTKGLF